MTCYKMNSSLALLFTLRSLVVSYRAVPAYKFGLRWPFLFAVHGSKVIVLFRDKRPCNWDLADFFLKHKF